MSKLKNLSDQIIVGTKFIETGKSIELTKSRLQQIRNQNVQNEVAKQSEKITKVQYGAGASLETYDDITEWYDYQPPLSILKPYLWQRSKTTGDWTYSCVSGRDGEAGESIVWKGSSSTPPSNPQKLWAYYNTTDKKSYIYNGSSWEQMTKDGDDATQYYYHVVYCDNTTSGLNYCVTPPSGGSLYIGTYTDTTIADAQDWATALTKNIKWDYSKGAKGDNGSSGATATPTYQYALADNGVTPTTFYDTIPTGWTYGKKYWIRIKYTWSDGRAVSYSDAWLDSATNEALEKSCYFSISANCTSYERDLRSSNVGSITLTSEYKGYDIVSYAWTSNIDSTTSTDSSITLTFQKNTVPDAITVTCTITYNYGSTTKTLSRYLFISSVDVTEYNKCFGINPSNPSTALEGDCYIKYDGTDYIPYIYHNNSWTELSSLDFGTYSVQVSKIRDEIMANGTNIPTTSTALYGYFKNLSAQTAVIDTLKTSDIALTTSGKLHSDGYSKGTVQKFISGELVPEDTKRGFYQDYDGNAEFFKADIYQANIYKAILTEATVEGTLKADTLETQNTQETGNSYANNALSTYKYWLASDAVSAVKNAIPSNTVVNATGQWNGNSFVRALNCTDNTTYKSVSGTTYEWVAPANVGIKVTPAYSGTMYVNGEVLASATNKDVTGGTNVAISSITSEGTSLPGYSNPHSFVMASTKQSDGYFYMVVTNYGDFFKSSDGINWTLVAEDTAMGDGAETLSSWAGIFAVGGGKFLYAKHDSSANTLTIYYSTNLTTWTAVSSGLPSMTSSDEVRITYADGRFFLIRKDSFNIYSSLDGISWLVEGTAPITNIIDIIYNGSNIVLVADSNGFLPFYYESHGFDLHSWTRGYLYTDINYVRTMYYLSSVGLYVILNQTEYSFSTSLTGVWSKPCPISAIGGFSQGTGATDGTMLVFEKALNQSRVSGVVKFGGSLSYKFNYPIGLYYLGSNSSDYSIIANWNNITGWRSEYSYCAYSGSTIYSCTASGIVGVSNKAFVFEGLKNSSTQVTVESGNVFSISGTATCQYKRAGDSSVTTISDAYGFSWTTTSLVIYRTSGSAITLDQNVPLISLNVAFTALAKDIGNYVKSLFPKTGSTYDVGSAGSRFNTVYGVNGNFTNIAGTLTGNVTGNVTGSISGGTVAGSTGTFSGAVSGASGNFSGGDIICGTIHLAGKSDALVRNIYISASSPSGGDNGDVWLVYE